MIGAYGEGPRRPQLRLRGKQSGLRFDIHDGYHDIAIVGLEFYAAGKDPASPEFSPECAVKSAIGVFISGKHMATGRRLLVENCCMRFCGASLQVARDRRAGPAPATEQLVFRRNLVLDNYSRTSHCQGTYAAGVSILLEENIYDHNGWLVQERNNRKHRGGATIFNHNTYFCDCHDVVFVTAAHPEEPNQRTAFELEGLSDELRSAAPQGVIAPPGAVLPGQIDPGSGIDDVDRSTVLRTDRQPQHRVAVDHLPETRRQS